MNRWSRIGVLFCMMAGIGGGVASAQDGYTFVASLAGGFAGAFDSAERDFDNQALQAGLGMFTSDRTLTVVRIGKVSFDSQQAFAGLFDSELEYANVAGEYRFRQAAYDYGFFVGVGSYRIEGATGGVRDTQTALGATLGFTGDFDLTRRLSFIAELDLHYVFFDESTFYGAGLVGVAVHF